MATELYKGDLGFEDSYKTKRLFLSPFLTFRESLRLMQWKVKGTKPSSLSSLGSVSMARGVGRGSHTVALILPFVPQSL